MQNSRYSYAHGGLSSLKEARDLLHSHAPKGEHLAYINPKEAALLKANGGSGIMTVSGIPSYGFLSKISKTVSKLIPKEISNTLNKIIPNEVKPFLPYAAAALPVLGGMGFLGSGLQGLSGAQLAALSAGTNVASQMAQEGYDKRGLNLISTGLAGVGGYLSGAGTAGDLSASHILANDASGLPITTGDIYAKTLEGVPSIGQVNAGDYGISQIQGPIQISDVVPGASTDLSYLQQGKNLITDTAASSANYLRPETKPDLLSLETAKRLAPGQIAAASEQAYNKAQEALDEYNAKLGNIKNMTQADLAERRKYVQQYMALAGFNQSDIDSALSRQGLMRGGRAGYEAGSNNEGVKTIPLSLDTIAKQLFGDRLDNLTYTQKESVYNRYYDLKDKKAKGGLMSLDGHEMDFRAAGGFVPIGKKERADDVPARLSKNEFVFTAKAVRNAGGGDIKHGAKRMYQLMKHLEAKA
jgi:hypothetical protein